MSLVRNPFPQAFPRGVVLRAANQNLTIASGNCTIMYRWHGAAVTDEGLASPHGRGAPGRGGEGDFYLLSHFVTAHPEWEPRGMRIATPVCALARNDSNCRNALQERYRAVPNRITNTDQPCTHCQRRLAANFFKSLLTK